MSRDSTREFETLINELEDVIALECFSERKLQNNQKYVIFGDGDGNSVISSRSESQEKSRKISPFEIQDEASLDKNLEKMTSLNIADGLERNKDLLQKFKSVAETVRSGRADRNLKKSKKGLVHVYDNQLPFSRRSLDKLTKAGLKKAASTKFLPKKFLNFNIKPQNPQIEKRQNRPKSKKRGGGRTGRGHNNPKRSRFKLMFTKDGFKSSILKQFFKKNKSTGRAKSGLRRRVKRNPDRQILTSRTNRSRSQVTRRSKKGGLGDSSNKICINDLRVGDYQLDYNRNNHG